MRRTTSIGFLLCFSVIVGFSANSLRGEEPRAGENKLSQKFFVRLGKDFGSVLSSPQDWRKADLLALAAVTGTGFLLYAYDTDIRDGVQENLTDLTQETSSFLYNWGGGGTLLGLITVLYASGELMGKDSLRRTALLSLESLAITTFYDWSMKFAVGRARPSSGKSSRSFQPFTFSSRYWSFPSGHAASTFAVATTIADQSSSVGVDVLAYGLATLVGVSAIYQNKHWASDVFIGSALGYFVAKKICSLNRRSQKQALSVGFVYTTHHQSLTLSWEF